MHAQNNFSSLAGEYYLNGVMETASGFKLNHDSTFQFFFSYGALDRSGEGKWRIKNDSIIFTSRKKPTHDFALVSSKQTGGDKITIKIAEQNEFMRSHVYCVIKGNGKEQKDRMDREGLILFDKQPIESIELLFEFCPEKSSIFNIQSGKENFFEFRFEPWIMESFFKDFALHIGKEELNGGHPLLKGESFQYEKAKP
jgi:hypothetical protein